MKRNQRTTKTIVFIVTIMMVFFSFSSLVIAEEDETYLNEQINFMKQLIRYIETNYTDEVTYEQLVNGAFKGLLKELDPYSTYFINREAYNNFVETVSGEFSGIGVMLEARNDECFIISPIFDSPAYKAGILSGDVIVEVDGKDVTALSISDIANMTRGESNTKVMIGVKRQGQSDIIRFEIIREIIKTDSVSTEIKENHIGYIRILSFDSNTGEEFKEALEVLKDQGIKSLIIDLRDNGGGFINTALEVAEQIVPMGPMMHFEKKGEIIQTYYSKTPQIDLPVAVLVNGGTASASEILAGAIQDTDIGTIIGTKTFGKGSAQDVINLGNGGGMKLTVNYFLTPNKNKIHGTGIIPDIVIKQEKSNELDALSKEVKGFAPMIEKEKPGLNDKGLNVYGAQQRLKVLGYSDVVATGIMDEITVNAIKHFQNAQGLFGYGILDYTTKDHLNEEIAKYIGNLDKDAQLEKAMEILAK